MSGKGGGLKLLPHKHTSLLKLSALGPCVLISVSALCRWLAEALRNWKH